MTQEVFGILKKMDMEAVETQIALRCAPLIAGLKLSNLLIVKSGQFCRVHQLLEGTGIDSLVLYKGGQKVTALLYREAWMAYYLRDLNIKAMLWQFGYRDFSMEGLSDKFAMRYQGYMQGGKTFPHEMGIFLGYPLEDVWGFIENNGKGALYTGYWKVYEDKPGKLHLFHVFDFAKEKLLKLLAQGVSMDDILKYCT